MQEWLSIYLRNRFVSDEAPDDECDNEADVILAHFKEQGMVIKVDGEVPGTFPSQAGHAFEKVVQQEMIDAGYTLTEELI